ncbi:MAG: flippase-like domain-containing protein [Chitinispirillaceae bacterium]|nr:flippase-like domain-containing protein [Chitinispirillaceae bacterium]
MLKLKTPLLTLLKAGVTLAIIILLVNKLGWEDIKSTAATARPVWLAAAILLFLASTFIGVFQWGILLHNRKIPLPFGRSCRLYFIGMFFNNFVFGGIVGDVLKIASIRSIDGKGKAGLAATFLDRFAGLWAMCGFAVAGSIVLLMRHGALRSGKVDTAMVALAGAFLLFAGILVFLLCKPMQRFCFTMLGRLPLAAKDRIRDTLSEMLIEAHDLHILFKVGTLSAVIQIMRIGVHLLVAASLGLLTTANFQYFFIFVPIIAMLMTIPLPFGVREAAGGTLFALAGFPEGAAYVMGFLATLVGLAGSFIGGLFYITDRTLSREQHENRINRHTALQ